ncbi:MAG: tRNA (guanosine(46)-N7)-methyltransferase TrmB [Myxococcota bacterium]
MRCRFLPETDMSRRIRKHANPFTVLTHLGPLDRTALFGRTAPLEIDLGCGGGTFLLDRAAAHPERDFIGLEIRKPLVDDNNRRVERRGLTNLRFFYANANINLDDQPAGSVDRFFVMFPDPCFKKRHWKRRILQPKLVREMTLALPIGGQIFAQSDIRPLAEEMLAFLTQESALRPLLGDSLQTPSPFAQKTEWERHHEAAGEPVYRMLFEKTMEPAGPIPEPEFRDTNPKRVNADGSRVEAIDPAFRLEPSVPSSPGEPSKP